MSNVTVLSTVTQTLPKVQMLLKSNFLRWFFCLFLRLYLFHFAAAVVVVGPSRNEPNFIMKKVSRRRKGFRAVNESWHLTFFYLHWLRKSLSLSLFIGLYYYILPNFSLPSCLIFRYLPTSPYNTVSNMPSPLHSPAVVSLYLSAILFFI